MAHPVLNRCHEPISRADVLRYDPSLKPGAVKRAFDRLVAGGWLIQAEQAKRQKHAYTPTWGRVKGAPLPWNLQDACYGRPRHIQRLMLDRNLFDICMGKLVPHAALPATITRYLTTPALTLVDIGCYALTLTDIVRSTPALRWLGLIHNEQPHPLPSEQRLLALISQQTLTLDAEQARDTELTLSGTRRIGLAPLTPPNPHDSTSQPLFFVPPSLIGSLIGRQIGAIDYSQGQPSASASAETSLHDSAQSITWESMYIQETRNPLLPPQTSTQNPISGGLEKNTDQKRQSRRRSRPESTTAHVIPSTESAQLLQSINILPEQVIELESISLETIHAAINDGKARPGIRDLAGWVVKLLRAHRDHGWTINPPRLSAESPEALRQAFARYAVEQEAACRAGQSEDQPWFPPPELEPLHISDAPIRLWNEVQSALKHHLTRNEFNTWIRRAALISLEQGVATIMVPTTLAQQAIAERYGSMLRDLLRMYTGESLELRVILNPNAVEQAVVETAPSVAAAAPPVEPSPIPHPPAWIAAERWAALPTMLRVALGGAKLVDGEVQGRTPHLCTLLRTRYAREVDELTSGSIGYAAHA